MKHIYEISLLADGHELQKETIIAPNINSAVVDYETKTGVNLDKQQYRIRNIGDVV